MLFILAIPAREHCAKCQYRVAEQVLQKLIMKSGSVSTL